MTDRPLIPCPVCSARYRVPEKLLGKKTRCQKCGNAFDLVAPDPSAGTALEGDDPGALLLRLVRERRADPQTRLGPQIADHDIERKLGQGGFGAVYLARHRRTHERVALKVLRSPVAVTATAVRRFEREVRILGQLHHPHIVQFIEDGRAGEVFYFTMAYYPAGSVAGLMLQRGGKLPLPEAAPIFLQVLHGLEYAHQQSVEDVREDGRPATVVGVVHRDLKPANLLLAGSAPRWTAVVSDFGLAKAFDLAGLSGITDTMSFGGTVLFTPREQVFEFKRVKPVSDVWSAAATFYHMVTGAYPRDPRPGLSPQEVVARCPIVPIRTRDPAVPEAVAAVVDRALADRVSERTPTVAELRTELERVL